MAFYYVRAFDIVVHGPFDSDEEMMFYHYANFENGDLLSIHESMESAYEEAEDNRVRQNSEDEYLEDLSAGWYK